MFRLSQVFEIKYHGLAPLLRVLLELNLEIFDVKEVNIDTYQFKVPYGNRKLIKSSLASAKPLNICGFFAPFIKLRNSVTTLIMMTLCLSYFYCSMQMISKINLSGGNLDYDKIILHELEQVGIKKNAWILDDVAVKKLNFQLEQKLINSLEFLELTSRGTTFNVNYKIRREAIIIPPLKGKIYALKDGIIERFELSHGLRLVSLGDFVKKGQLLVTDYMGDESEETHIYTYGKIIAKTWTTITVKTKNINSEAEELNELIQKATQILMTWNQEPIEIKERRILKKSRNEKEFEVTFHFTTLENIGGTED